MKKYILALITLFSIFSLTGAFASGGYGGGGGGSSSSSKKAIKQESFQLGQSVFTNKASIADKAGSLSITRSQERTLTTLKSQLAKKNKSAADKLNVDALAGKLSSEQLRALRYYVDVRYINPTKYKQ